MKYFIDTEFNENVHPIELISVGIVAENGREYYGLHDNYAKHAAYLRGDGKKEDYPHLHSCNAWVKKNVLPYLHLTRDMRNGDIRTIANSEGLKNAIALFVDNDPFPEFWAYYGHYDWFLITQLFGSFMNLPKNWPHACYDILQFARHAGVSKTLPVKLEPQHNALVDAKWTMDAYNTILTAWNDDRSKVTKERRWP